MKNIVLCFDGTWNDPAMRDGDAAVTTNVCKLFEATIDDSSQHKWYDKGVGTQGLIDRFLGGGIGVGLNENVREGYAQLLENYKEGDQIFLFGFSRGACTARSLAGLLNSCGLVQKDKWENSGKKWEVNRVVDYVFDVYKRSRRFNLRSHNIAIEFKKRFSISGFIHLIGVWDTVNSLGLIMDSWNRVARKLGLFCFHDVRLRKNVMHAYHALAIDEQRWYFYPRLWDSDDIKRAKGEVEQVWFAGVHGNVGGSYEDAGLSDIALNWMLCHAVNKGLRIDWKKLNIKPNPHGKLRLSHKEGFWKYSFLKYMRKIPNNAKIHESVLKRIEKTSNKTTPQTRYERRSSHTYVITPPLDS